MKISKNSDIYFDANYGKLYEEFEGGKSEVFCFENEWGRIRNQYIKREIPIKVGEDTYYDIITPNGYGGPIIEECQVGAKDKLISDFINAFTVHCNNEKIVCEFLRFHPLFNNAEDFKSVYNIDCIRKTLGTNLKDYEDPIQSEFSKSCRKNIRKALKEGVTYEVIENPDTVDDFKEIYFSTMDRNTADKDYYFNDEYFKNILGSFQKNILSVKAIYDDKTIAQGLYFIHGKKIHIHLSGTLSEYLYLSPAYILRYAVTLWGKESGFEIIHHGGGRTNSLEDGLYKFKKGFSKNTEFNFYVGRKIWNEQIYLALCKEQLVDSEIEYFPAYRFSAGNYKC